MSEQGPPRRHKAVEELSPGEHLRRSGRPGELPAVEYREYVKRVHEDAGLEPPDPPPGETPLEEMSPRQHLGDSRGPDEPAMTGPGLAADQRRRPSAASVAADDAAPRAWPRRQLGSPTVPDPMLTRPGRRGGIAERPSRAISRAAGSADAGRRAVAADQRRRVQFRGDRAPLATRTQPNERKP